jgi:hypothetical protein
MSATFTLVAEMPGALALLPAEPEPPLLLFEVDPFEELLQPAASKNNPTEIEKTAARRRLRQPVPRPFAPAAAVGSRFCIWDPPFHLFTTEQIDRQRRPLLDVPAFSPAFIRVGKHGARSADGGNVERDRDQISDFYELDIRALLD